MKFTQESAADRNLIRAYGAGELRINDRLFRTAVIVSARTIATPSDLHAVGQLRPEHAAALLELQPEVVLLGTGPRQVFPDAAFGAGFLQAGIGFEVMDTGAACRTFNVLTAELRQVVALLMI